MRSEYKSISLLIILGLLSVTNLTSALAAIDKPIYTKNRDAKVVDIQSLTFHSSGITVNGKKYLLASKTPISLSFEDKSLSISSGCNTMGGRYSLSKGVLRTKTLYNTKISCSEKLFNQDLWLNQLISSKPKITNKQITSKSKVRTPSIIITLTSNVTPTLKSGKTIIKMNIYETYGYADTPLGDDNSTSVIKTLCSQLTLNKASETQAQYAAEQNALLFRVRSREGVEYAGTSDYIQNRINVEILQGVINNCTQG